MLKLVEKLHKHLEESRFQGKEKSIDRARRRGKLLARERIELLLDQDSTFLELLPLAGMQKKGGFGAGGTSVSGIGLVAGKLCMINSNVGTRKGGSVDYTTVYKGFRVGQITRECRLPTINMVESGGANLPDQAKIFNVGGEGFREITRRSEMGIPTISVVFGNATAGGAYIPGMSDYAIFQKQAAKVFLAGPPLVKMATNEDATDEELGGAEMHSRVSGSTAGSSTTSTACGKVPTYDAVGNQQLARTGTFAILNASTHSSSCISTNRAVFHNQRAVPMMNAPTTITSITRNGR
ncbi:MAG: carboxyl transferase domain-containing protein [Planctomycetota bacterium]